MRLIVRILLYLVAFIVPIVLSGGGGLIASVGMANSRPPDTLASVITPSPTPRYDPTKPTVAVVLGNQVSEVTDVIGPYAMFAESGLYNVYTVASTRTLHTLTGGLDLVPHFSFAELDALLGHSPDIVVVPQTTGPEAPENRPLLDYIRRQARGDTLVFSWCTGAGVLAASGVLDGKPATAHWGDIDQLERAYPAVLWQRGLRYVESGRLLTSAGITSGFDATLYLLSQWHGAAVAERVARALHYPSFDFVAAPAVEQYHFSLPDSIFVLNGTFNWAKHDAGVWLYDGVGDLELAAVLDTFSASLTTRTFSVGDTRRIVTTRYGLQLLPRWDVDTLPPLDRLLVPGGTSAAQTNASLTALEGRIVVPIVRMHDNARPSFAFEAPLADLARETNVPTAAFAAKRLEYRASSMQLEGTGWPILLTLQPLLIGAVGVSLVRWISRRYDQRREQHRVQQTTAVSPATTRS
jgi:AraC family transcriptional regulator, transcriptional activator FtrA